MCGRGRYQSGNCSGTSNGCKEQPVCKAGSEYLNLWSKATSFTCDVLAIGHDHSTEPICTALAKKGGIPQCNPYTDLEGEIAAVALICAARADCGGFQDHRHTTGPGWLRLCTKGSSQQRSTDAVWLKMDTEQLTDGKPGKGVCTPCRVINPAARTYTEQRFTCPKGEYRKGTCGGEVNGHSCHTCSNQTCTFGQYRSGFCAGATDGYRCNAQPTCKAGERLTGSSKSTEETCEGCPAGMYVDHPHALIVVRMCVCSVCLHSACCVAHMYDVYATSPLTSPAESHARFQETAGYQGTACESQVRCGKGQVITEVRVLTQ